jgi:hypothetical protein|eukprot:g6497.t1
MPFSVLICLVVMTGSAFAQNAPTDTGTFVPEVKNDVLTPKCLRARQRFNSDPSFVHNLMDFYVANKNVSGPCFTKRNGVTALSDCDLQGKWKRMEDLNRECQRGHGKVCFESLTINVNGKQYQMKHVVTGCVPRQCEDPRDQSTAMVMITSMCQAIGVRCDVNCVDWECSLPQADAEPGYTRRREDPQGMLRKGGDGAGRLDYQKTHHFQKCLDHSLLPPRTSNPSKYMTPAAAKKGKWWAETD